MLRARLGRCSEPPLFPRLQRQTFDDGKFQTPRGAAMASGSDSSRINGVLSSRTVIGLNDAAWRWPRDLQTSFAVVAPLTDGARCFEARHNSL